MRCTYPSLFDATALYCIYRALLALMIGRAFLFWIRNMDILTLPLNLVVQYNIYSRDPSAAVCSPPCRVLVVWLRVPLVRLRVKLVEENTIS